MKRDKNSSRFNFEAPWLYHQVQKSNLEGLLQRHVEMAAEIKNLDTDLQIMKNNIVGMEVNMEQLLEKIMSVQSRSDGFIYDLPTTLGKCIKSEAYSDAVRFYTGAMPIFKAYGDSSFQDCKKASEEVISVIINKLQEKVSSDSESIQARAEAVMLLKQLDFPVESLKSKLLENLQQFLGELDLSKEISMEGSESQVPTREFVEAVHAYHVIFPDSEQQLVKLVQYLTTRHFEAAKQQIQQQISSAQLSNRLRFIWTDVLLIDEVLPEAALQDFAFEAACIAVSQYVASAFTHLLHEISDILVQLHKDGKGEEYPLRVALEATKSSLVQGTTKVLLDFRLLLDEELGLILKLQGKIIGWIHEGFQTFFRQLHDQLLLVSGQQEHVVSADKEIGSSLALSGGYEYSPAFVPGEVRNTFRSAAERFLQRVLYKYENPENISSLEKEAYYTKLGQGLHYNFKPFLTLPLPFVVWNTDYRPCILSTKNLEKFICLLICFSKRYALKLKSLITYVILHACVITWQLGAVGREVKQVLPQGLTRKHARTESNGSTSSSRSNTLRDDKINRSNANRARSQLLETHLAKLFKQKMEIFTKVEHTQESVVMSIVKLCLKSFQEFVRLQTFNRSGFQQIQLDMQYLRTTLKDTTEDEAALEFLLDEQDVANRKVKAIEIDLGDLFDYKDLDKEFVGRVTENTRRYVGVFADAIDELIPEPTEAFQDDDLDILMTQRAEEGNDNADGTDPRQKMPPEIRLYIKASSKDQPFTIREVRASHIGQLVKISGIVTRCTDVKPLMKVAVYTCEECGFEIYQEVTARVFMPLFECPSKRCNVNRAKGSLILQLRASKFWKFQEAKLQELTEHVPKGHIPRSMTVHFRGELTRKVVCYENCLVSPGDVVELSGIFLPIPYTGFRAMRAGLVADTYLETIYELKGVEEEEIDRLAEDGDIYNKLARSLAPEIFGHEDIKKALLLLLVGAPHRKLKDGMKIRGDLHICLMGDPGVAKSQLLKHIITVAPRGVYTTGKGSSGVGLTAAVQKDPVTNEFVLEGGALVLADMGICAIDEFDKMDESDRTAIHEVMEQQTVSIAKAGITTSLNARTAVLAAANPAWGRYDLRRTPAENINLPPALLSRFDLLWLILDKADMDNDLELARHVVYVHQNRESPALGFAPLEASVLRAYISAARKLSPYVPRELEEYIATAYSSIRQEEAKSNSPHSYTTIRTLLSIIRIATALARLRFSEVVAQSDVDEALRLMQMSKFSLYSEDRQKSGLDAISDIYSILRDEAARSNKMDVTYGQALNRISRMGYTEAQLKECLEEYAALNVWQIHPNTFDIRFIDA
ncbi:hypothetical protein LXL04_018944 [Taraxacum kok-saghyz]